MNRGLVFKALRETRVGTVLFVLALFAFHLALTIILPLLLENFGAQLMDNPFIRNISRAFLGPMADNFGPQSLLAFAWLHPLVLSLVWAHVIMSCTRWPAGEVDRGTADLLLSLPVSRWQIYGSEAAVWLTSGALLMFASVAGHLCGAVLSGSEHRMTASQLAGVACNLYALYVAVGGITCLISSACDRRGRAIAWAFAVVLLSFFLQVIGQFWRPAGEFAFLGLMHYYQPQSILQTGEWPLAKMAVLLGVGMVAWAAGGVLQARRDILTV